MSDQTHTLAKPFLQILCGWRKLRCRCGHQPQAHEHYRAGTDCALCECRRFRR